MPRSTYVVRGGQVVAKRLAPPRPGAPDRAKRSTLPAPQIIRDIEPYESMIDGSMIDSRSRHRDHLRENEFVEIGDAAPDWLKERRRMRAEGEPIPDQVKAREPIDDSGFEWLDTDDLDSDDG